MRSDGLRLAIEAMRRRCGHGSGVAELARGLGVTRQAISQWREVPATRVLEVERLTEVSRSVLRPDLYPPPEPRAEPRVIRDAHETVSAAHRRAAGS